MRQGVLNRLSWLTTGTATVALLLLAGCAASMNSTVTSPVFTPSGGSFTTAQTVTVSDTTPGAVLHCTTDGSSPTASSPVCSQPVTVYKSETLSAVAVMDQTTSAVATATFTIALPAAATPVISPTTGTFVSAQTVTISDATAGAIIYYTVDGSAPTTASPVYGGPITVSSTQTINAIAVSPATTVSDVATATFTINLPAPTPVISPPGGTFTSIQTATITDAAAGAVIYYTTDGSAPTVSSAMYTGPITVGKSETITAIATAPGSSPSATATAAFVINLPPAATPVISPAGGTFAEAQTVTLTDSTAGAAIYYTLDGTTPTEASTRYSAPFQVSKSETVKAIAAATGYSNSAVASADFTINLTVATPVIAPAGGTFTSVQSVTITDETPGATIHYTLDGSAPTASSPTYTGSVSVTQSSTLKAIGVDTGYSNSAVASATFVLNLPPAAAPVISPASGTFTTAQTVTITDASPAATIYYTTDGSNPTTASTRYTAPFTFDATGTIKAIATATGFSTSPISTATLTFNQPNAATPIISPGGGTYNSGQVVAITDATPQSTIHYTIDGSVPTASSPIYTDTIGVTQSATVQAIATAPGFNASAVATATFTINLPQTATPVISPAGGTFTAAQTVTISDATGAAIIYYTLDGSTPTEAATMYTDPITVSATQTIKAIATAPDHSISAVTSVTFTINQPPVATPIISPNGGTFTSAQTVTIIDATTGAAIYYTVDGSTPSAASTRYTAPIMVSATETIKAIGILSGSPDSSVATATFTFTAVAGIPISGIVESGTTPISGSQVQLYAAGTTGYGSAPTALLSAPVTTTSAGGFALGFASCPAAPGDQLYLVATGGDAGHGANSGIALMLALGTCASITSGTSFTINETTTVASAYALAQFASSATGGGINIGTPAPIATCFSNAAETCNYVGLQNAFKNANNLVDAASGAARTITPFYATSPVPYLNSSTVPQARINTLADVLASCVAATSAAGCPSLYTAATPAGGTAPADSLQAILSIAQNPGQNVAALYGLIAATPPYTPNLTAAPNDFALALTFTGGGLGLRAGTAAFQVINKGLDIDTAGNIWVVAYNTHGGIGNSSMIAKFNAAGEALTPATTQTTDHFHSVVYGGFRPGNGVMVGPSALAIDQSGNAWVNGTLDLTEVTSGLTVAQSNLGTSNGTGAVTIDMLGNVLVTSQSSATTTIEEFMNDGTLLTPTPWDGTSADYPSGFQKVERLLFDSTGTTLWASDQDGYGDLYRISPSNGQILYNYVAAPNNPTENYTALVADNTGNIYGCGTGDGTSLNVFNSSSMSVLSTFPIGNGRGCGGGPMVIDGMGHIFASNSESPNEFFDEFTTSGTLITPAALGYTATSSDEDEVLNSPVAAAIDASGNLWALNFDTGSQPSPTNVLVQFIGIAAPVVTPTSLALQNNELATRP